MLPKKRRIERKDFTTLLQTGKRYSSPHFLLYAQRSAVLESKFAFSVSKKVAKRAVDRNKLRRRGYAVIRRQSARLSGGYMCFFSFKKDSNRLSFENIEKEITRLLTEASVLS